MITPIETAWFQYWDTNQNVIDLAESDFYKDDLIGLRQLNDEGKIQFVEFNGGHLSFDEKDMEKCMLRFTITI